MSEQQQTLTIQQAIDLAVQHHNAGRLPEAENIYQQILQSEPNHPTALHLLGAIAHQVGKNDTAVDLIARALALNPDLAEAHYNLGNALWGLGKPDDAVTSYRKRSASSPIMPTRTTTSALYSESLDIWMKPSPATERRLASSLITPRRTTTWVPHSRALAS